MNQQYVCTRMAKIQNLSDIIFEICNNAMVKSKGDQIKYNNETLTQINENISIKNMCSQSCFLDEGREMGLDRTNHLQSGFVWHLVIFQPDGEASKTQTEQRRSGENLTG